VIAIGTPFLVTFGDWRFLNVTIQMYAPGTSDLVLFGVIKNAQGQTVGVATGGVTMTQGETSNAYALVYNVSPGTYTAFVFVIAVQYNAPYSIPLSEPLTL